MSGQLALPQLPGEPIQQYQLPVDGLVSSTESRHGERFEGFLSPWTIVDMIERTSEVNVCFVGSRVVGGIVGKRIEGRPGR